MEQEKSIHSCTVYMYTYIFIIQASVYDTNKIIHSVKIVRQLWTKVRLFILNNGQIFRHMTKTVTSFIVNVHKNAEYLVEVAFTLLENKWWRYSLYLCDEMFNHFPLFDETLRHIEVSNSVISHIQRNPPKLSVTRPENRSCIP